MDNIELNRKSNKQLKEMLKAKGIKGYSNVDKEKLITMLGGTYISNPPKEPMDDFLQSAETTLSNMTIKSSRSIETQTEPEPKQQSRRVRVGENTSENFEMAIKFGNPEELVEALKKTIYTNLKNTPDKMTDARRQTILSNLYEKYSTRSESKQKEKQDIFLKAYEALLTDNNPTLRVMHSENGPIFEDKADFPSGEESATEESSPEKPTPREPRTPEVEAYLSYANANLQMVMHKYGHLPPSRIRDILAAQFYASRAEPITSTGDPEDDAFMLYSRENLPLVLAENPKLSSSKIQELLFAQFKASRAAPNTGNPEHDAFLTYARENLPIVIKEHPKLYPSQINEILAAQFKASFLPPPNTGNPEHDAFLMYTRKNLPIVLKEYPNARPTQVRARLAKQFRLYGKAPEPEKVRVDRDKRYQAVQH